MGLHLNKNMLYCQPEQKVINKLKNKKMEVGGLLGAIAAVHIIGYCIAFSTYFDNVIEVYEEALKSKSKLLNLITLFFWFIFVPEIEYVLLIMALGREVRDLIS